MARPIYIDDCPGATLEGVRDKLIRLRDRSGLDLCVVDYLQLMTAKARENRVREVSASSRGLKVLARD